MQRQKLLILDGKKLASEISADLQLKIAKFKIKPKFVIIQVGDDFASNKYVNSKIKKATEIGIESSVLKLSETIKEKELIDFVKITAEQADALIVQLPLPKKINQQNVLDAVPFQKDVDGLSLQNSKSFYAGKEAIIPATPKGILMLLQKYNVQIKDKNTYVIGESNLVGKPIKELLQKNGGITKSFNINTTIKGSEEADVLIVAAGQSHLVKASNVKQGAVVVDVGINSLSNNKIIGDVDFEDVLKKVSAISPVPGGVGPMTVIALMANIVEVFLKNKQNKKN